MSLKSDIFEDKKNKRGRKSIVSQHPEIIPLVRDFIHENGTQADMKNGSEVPFMLGTKNKDIKNLIIKNTSVSTMSISKYLLFPFFSFYFTLFYFILFYFILFRFTFNSLSLTRPRHCFAPTSSTNNQFWC